jgi:hypothetical protein
MYVARAEDVLRQMAKAGEVEAEYRRRLEAEGFAVGYGAADDCVVTRSDAEAVRVDEIFRETCEELLNRPRGE